MQHGSGEIIADYGFNFFEKIHEPIFLLNRQGKIKKINEAARNFLKISHVDSINFEHFATEQIKKLFPNPEMGFKRALIGQKNLRFTARSYGNSNLVLVELRR